MTIADALALELPISYVLAPSTKIHAGWEYLVWARTRDGADVLVAREDGFKTRADARRVVMRRSLEAKRANRAA